MCLVECEGLGVISSCTLAPRDGMVVKTNTDTIRNMRKATLQLLLANHDVDCTSCPKSGKCRLQELARRYGVDHVPYKKVREKGAIDKSSPSLVRDPSKCVLCGNCVRACSEIQGISVLDFAKRGFDTVVQPAMGMPIGKVDCVNCGQCAAVCPTGAIVSHSYNDEIMAAIHDPNKFVVAQIAPAVRVGLGEEFGLKPGTPVMGKMVAAMHRLGFDLVCDTAFAADFTTIEEGTEILGRVTKGENLPVFTSCCPAWVKYAEEYQQDMLGHLSSCKSPQEMGAALFRRMLPEKIGKDNKDIFIVSVMPCTAKKFEVAREEFSHDGVRDINISMTTAELADLIRELGVDFNSLPDEACDDPMGLESGAGVIYGATGGVTEAVVRFAAEKLTGKKPENLDFKALRGAEGIREVEVEVAGIKLNLCQVFGLANVRKVCEMIRSGEKKYHVVEVMACPGGCVNGAGQPHMLMPDKIVPMRTSGLYGHDANLKLRTATDNEQVAAIYKQYLEDTPHGHEAHRLLHTHYHARPKFIKD